MPDDVVVTGPDVARSSEIWQWVHAGVHLADTGELLD